MWHDVAHGGPVARDALQRAARGAGRPQRLQRELGRAPALAVPLGVVLALSIKTVEKHRQEMMDRLHIHNVAILAR